MEWVWSPAQRWTGPAFPTWCSYLLFKKSHHHCSFCGKGLWNKAPRVNVHYQGSWDESLDLGHTRPLTNHTYQLFSFILMTRKLCPLCWDTWVMLPQATRMVRRADPISLLLVPRPLCWSLQTGQKTVPASPWKQPLSALSWDLLWAVQLLKDHWPLSQAPVWISAAEHLRASAFLCHRACILFSKSTRKHRQLTKTSFSMQSCALGTRFSVVEAGGDQEYRFWVPMCGLPEWPQANPSPSELLRGLGLCYLLTSSATICFPSHL